MGYIGVLRKTYENVTLNAHINRIYYQTNTYIPFTYNTMFNSNNQQYCDVKKV